MLAGHYATALVAQQRAPSRQFPAYLLAWYLAVSQLPDLLWLVFHTLGLEPTRPTDLLDVTLQDLSVDMMFSHDVVPIVGWAVLFGILGAVVFRERCVGLATVALAGLHALTDYLGCYPHHVLGPETPVVGTGLYLTLPYLGIALEAVYIVFFVGWFLRDERRRGVVRSPGYAGRSSGSLCSTSPSWPPSRSRRCGNGSDCPSLRCPSTPRFHRSS